MTLIDAHIHIHECYDLASFFNAAKSNFQKQAKWLNKNISLGILCLTESYNVDYFARLEKMAEANEAISNWRISSTLSENTLVLNDQDNFKIFVVAGRQIVTKENLEVLALGLVEIPEDGNPIDEVIKFVQERKCIPIIPWGFGKWSGKRKKNIERIVLQTKSRPIHLGDNGNRPWFLQKSKLFKTAEYKGILNLPGSDPLPFNREMSKPGTFGFMVEGDIEGENPFENIFELIAQTKKQPETYGNFESVFYFFKNQIAMQLVKRNRNK